MFHTLSLFFPLPVGSSLPGMMEANEVLRCSAAGDAAQKLWELWGGKKRGEKKEEKSKRKRGRWKV